MIKSIIIKMLIKGFKDPYCRLIHWELRNIVCAIQEPVLVLFIKLCHVSRNGGYFTKPRRTISKQIGIFIEHRSEYRKIVFAIRVMTGNEYCIPIITYCVFQCFNKGGMTEYSVLC